MKVLLNHRNRVVLLGVVSLILGFGFGCASRHAYLVPAPSDNLTNGGRAVSGSADGIDVTVTPNDWSGRPRDLYRRVTPIKVRIENHSKQPLRLVYRDFKLLTSQGTQLVALPPSAIRGSHYVSENRTRLGPHFTAVAWRDPGYDRDVRGGHREIITPGFDWDDFYYAPYWTYGYVGIGPWPYGWAPNMGYYYSYYPYMRAVHLPTRSMLKLGIPEGVIGPGGYVEGFLYFERVSPELRTVEFIATLQAARSGRQFGTVRIPFVVETK